MAFPDKLVELWSEWYLDPKTRYHYIKRLRPLLPRFLPLAPLEEAQVAAGSEHLTRFSNPQELAADKLWKMIQTFKETTSGLSEKGEIQKKRRSVIARLNGVKIYE